MKFVKNHKICVKCNQNSSIICKGVCPPPAKRSTVSDRFYIWINIDLNRRCFSSSLVFSVISRLIVREYCNVNFCWQLTELTLTVFPSHANVTSHKASRCSNEVKTPVKLVGWLFQRRQNCWSIVPRSVMNLKKEERQFLIKA